MSKSYVVRTNTEGAAIALRMACAALRQNSRTRVILVVLPSDVEAAHRLVVAEGVTRGGLSSRDINERMAVVAAGGPMIGLGCSHLILCLSAFEDGRSVSLTGYDAECVARDAAWFSAQAWTRVTEDGEAFLVGPSAHPLLDRLCEVTQAIPIQPPTLAATVEVDEEAVKAQREAGWHNTYLNHYRMSCTGVGVIFTDLEGADAMAAALGAHDGRFRPPRSLKDFLAEFSALQDKS